MIIYYSEHDDYEDGCEYPANKANDIDAVHLIYKIETDSYDTVLIRNTFKDTIPFAGPAEHDAHYVGEIYDKQVWVGDIARTIVESLKLQQMQKPTSEELKVKILNSLTPKKY